MEKNIIHGPELEETIDMTLGELLMLLLQMHGDKVLQVCVYEYFSNSLSKFKHHSVQVSADSGEQATGSDILKRSIRIARWLQSKGLGPGDRISIMSENCLEFVLIPCAAFLSGITIAPLNPEYTAGKTLFTLTHCCNLLKIRQVYLKTKVTGYRQLQKKNALR